MDGQRGMLPIEAVLPSKSHLSACAKPLIACAKLPHMQPPSLQKFNSLASAR
jgi:hypothetical protein